MPNLNLVFFSDLRPEDRSHVGGKAYSLGVMTTNGVAVPPGFVVTTRVFDKFKHSRTGRDFDKFISQLLNAFDNLGASKVAVRSSATAEDSDAESWAGQLESYLNVDRDHLTEAVLKCWDSISSQRVQAYSRSTKAANLSVAVVVQAMVNSDVAGVAFTSDPVADPNNIMIEAGFGLGEAVVQALITSDQYLVDKQTLAIVDKIVGTQEIIIEAVNGQSVQKPLSTEQGSRQKLSDAEIVNLAKQAKTIEAIYKKPMDIEWARQQNKLYIVQARPITTALS